MYQWPWVGYNTTTGIAVVRVCRKPNYSWVLISSFVQGEIKYKKEQWKQPKERKKQYNPTSLRPRGRKAGNNSCTILLQQGIPTVGTKRAMKIDRC
jgi:hypothetical protein